MVIRKIKRTFSQFHYCFKIPLRQCTSYYVAWSGTLPTPLLSWNLSHAPPSGISWIIIQFINYSNSLLAAPLAFNPTFLYRLRHIIRKMISLKDNMPSPAWTVQPVLRTSLSGIKCVRLPRAASFWAYSYSSSAVAEMWWFSTCRILSCLCTLAPALASDQNQSSPFFVWLPIYLSIIYPSTLSPRNISYSISQLVCCMDFSPMTALPEYF